MFYSAIAAPHLTPSTPGASEHLLELGLDLRPGFRAPARVQHHAQDSNACEDFKRSVA